MLRALRAVSSGAGTVIRVASGVRRIFGALRSARAGMGLSPRVGVVVAADPLLGRAGVVPVGRRRFSTTPHGLMAESAQLTVAEAALLRTVVALERFQQLQGQPEQATAAVAALEKVATVENRPSRTLVERLIADDGAWCSVYDQWQKLTENKAKWDDLVAMCETHGDQKVKAELERIGLTFGAAQALGNLVRSAAGKPEVDVGARVERTYFYYISPPAVEPVLEKVAAGTYVFLHGPQASGKTTTLRALQAKLAWYPVAYIDFKRLDVNANSPTAVVDPLKLIEESMQAQFPGFPTLTDDGFKFVEAFTEPEHTQWTRGRKIVLMWDDFDLVFTKATFGAAMSLLSALRVIKQDPDRVVHGMVFAGTYGMIYKTSLSDFLNDIGGSIDDPGVALFAAGSPFNIPEEVRAPFFSLENVQELLRRMARVWDVAYSPDDGLAERILKETSGHPGTVAVYLRLIQDRMAKAQRALTLANFIAHVEVHEVLAQLMAYRSTSRMTEFFRPQHWDMLRRIFLLPPYAITFGAMGKDRPLILAMTQEGLVVPSDVGTIFQFLSPAVREMARLRLVQQRVPCLLPTSTFSMDNESAMVESLKTAICYIGRQLLLSVVKGKERYFFGTKLTAVATTMRRRERDMVPNEGTYHLHLLSVLYSWLSRSSAHVAVPPGDKPETKCSILVSQGPRRVLIELVAHARLVTNDEDDKPKLKPPGVDEHVRRLGMTYQPVVGAQHAIVVAFYYGRPKSDLWWPLVDGKPSSVSDKGVRLMYAIHEKGYRAVTFITGPEDKAEKRAVMC